ncbi:MAG: cell division protein FtsW [Chitinispirillaceae bacterium]|nr:cell division protein FtsW [Chitinispirillaceae bacterium]
MSRGMARMDVGLFVAVLMILGFGIVLVYSSSFALAEQRFGGSEFFFARQMLRALLALAGFMVFINVDYHLWSRMSNLGYAVAVILLLIVLALPDSAAINGSKRWLAIGTFKFQVSDIARMALILFIARHAEQAGVDIKKHTVYLKLIAQIVVICVLILAEPDFSTSSIIGLIGITMLFMAGARVVHLVGLVGTALPAALLVAWRMPHCWERIEKFIAGLGNIQALGYQAYQSIIGLGNGGLFGVGIGKGEQKFFYLPEPHTDFVISILGEEIGFIGLMVVAAVFAFIVYRGMHIARKAPDKTGQLMAFGCTFTIAIYALLHAAVAVGMMPTTGIPLPLISYGGMGLVFTVCSMGIVLNISSQSRFGMVDESIRPAQRLSRLGS